MTDETLKDIVVTTPKKLMDQAADEAKYAKGLIENGEYAFYFRTFKQRPHHLAVESRIYYVENGFVRGFGTVDEIVDGSMNCDFADLDYDGYHAIMPADNWQWIKPIAMKGFQGWRYFKTPRKEVQIVGNWLDEKPNPSDFL